jgi:putative nucleotidyltransferase with HDIG domain
LHLKRINDFFASADFLPPAFELLPRLLLLLEDVEANADALADLIRADPGLTANILRVCNSAAYGLQFPVDNIQQAILRIGFKEVHRVIMSVIASEALKDAEVASAKGQPDLWGHSLAAAYASQTICIGSGLDSDVTFTAALLHDIGKVVLHRAVPEEMAAAQRISLERNEPLYLSERELLKTDHAVVGARLLERWAFPKTLIAAVRHHHEPAAAKGEPRLASCVCLANALAYRIDPSGQQGTNVPMPDKGALKELGLTPAAFEALEDESRANFESARKGLV